MTTFESLNIASGILQSIKDLGFENPMPVQAEVIPIALKGERDIIALAQTGTGKTAAFGIPLLQNIDTSITKTQALVLCPTRELCIQITKDIEDLATHTKNVRILAVYGGASIEQQIRELKKGNHIIVATPGRLIDLMGRKAARLNDVNTVVLDEADEMLNMGFLDSIEQILSEVPEDKKTLLFSATMPQGVASIAGRYMRNPVEITIGRKNEGSANVTHTYYLVPAKEKYKVLRRICDSEPDIYGIIFCRTRSETQEIANRLMHDGYNADVLHGDLSQAQRDSVMQKFRLRNIQMLVATDVAARGLDVDDLTHVINFSLPQDGEVYTHRSGRTGRAGKKGISISLVNLKEKHLLQQIEKKVKKPFILMKIPTGREICGKQLFHWIGKLESVDTDHQQIDSLLPEIYDRLKDLSREELIRRVVNLEFNRFLEDYKNAPDIEVPSGERGQELAPNRKNKRNQITGAAEEGFTRFFINLGRLDGIKPSQIIDLINKNTRGKKIPVGKIDLMREFSFFEIESSFTKDVLEAMGNITIMERNIVVKIAREKDDMPKGRDTSTERPSDQNKKGKKDRMKSKAKRGRY